MPDATLVLGIETSCDETGVALVRLTDDGEGVNWQQEVAAPYNITQLLDALVVEAAAKHCGIVVIAKLEQLAAAGDEPKADSAEESDEAPF